MNKYLLGLPKAIADAKPDFTKSVDIRQYVGDRLGTALVDYKIGNLTLPDLEATIRGFNKITGLSVGFDLDKKSFINAGEEETIEARENVRRILRERER